MRGYFFSLMFTKHCKIRQRKHFWLLSIGIKLQKSTFKKKVEIQDISISLSIQVPEICPTTTFYFISGAGRIGHSVRPCQWSRLRFPNVRHWAEDSIDKLFLIILYLGNRLNKTELTKQHIHYLKLGVCPSHIS